MPDLIPELHIDKLEAGLYAARLLDPRHEKPSVTVHESIADAIKHVAVNLPPDKFVDVRYLTVSVGTQTVQHMATHSEALARRLVGLAAAVWQAAEFRRVRQESPKDGL